MTGNNDTDCETCGGHAPDVAGHEDWQCIEHLKERLDYQEDSNKLAFNEVEKRIAALEVIVFGRAKEQ